MGFLKFIKSLFSGSKKESLPLPVIETPVVQKTKVEEPIVKVVETVSDKKAEEIAQVEDIKEVVKTEEVKEVVKTEEKKKTAKEIKARVRKPATPKSDESAPKNKPKPRRRNKNKKAE